jgi:Domain of unknown function (DUF1864)
MYLDENIIFDSENWVRNNIPDINSAVLEKRIDIHQLLRIIEPPVQKIYKAIFSREGELVGVPTKSQARKIIQILGFLISSVGRHFQSQGNGPGTGISYMREVEPICDYLSKCAEHPPRDTSYTYWMWNNEDNPITFTNNPQEKIFNRVVNATNDIFTVTCDYLRVICTQEVSIDSPEAVSMLNLATQQLERAKQLFISLMKYNFQSQNQRNLEPHFFMTELRTYLVHYPINGIMWQAVNAGNIASQMQLDYLNASKLIMRHAPVVG